MPETATRMVWAGAAADAARAVAVVLHGRGQTPKDMTGAICDRLATRGVRFVLPSPGGAGWYDAKAVEPMTDRTETQLRAALSIVAEAEAAARAACPGVPLVLIGFSQGACLVIEHLMRGGQADAAAMLTGCRVGAGTDGLPRADLPGIPVYCSNGDDDPWIPTWAFLSAISDLTGAGARLRCDVFPGRAHEVSAPEIAALDGLLADVAAGQTAFGGAA
ncbi:alpha/beta hydrolase [Anianabacter salinae]|uniref:alpha/beta hydrolase n=1 Tax=Anianabacter salinae TaxID=2851023 RepID=UPI00225E5A37|nr:dienelactone hydrolase family protein [Anianabacter salinae]MBV0912461.1 dienelactone hydrolase family protein [Anianabacter salinae]